MNTQELVSVLATAPLGANGQPLRVVCLDEGCVFDAKFAVVKIDACGALVTKQRLRIVAAQREPTDRALQEQCYNDPFWHSRYPSFEDFYDFIEKARLDENKLVDEAVEVAVLHADYMEM